MEAVLMTGHYVRTEILVDRDRAHVFLPAEGVTVELRKDGKFTVNNKKANPRDWQHVYSDLQRALIFGRDPEW